MQSSTREAYLAAVLDSTDDAVVAKTLDGTIVWINPAAERLFGYRADELAGKSVLTLIPLDRVSEEDSILNRIRRGERVEHFETVRRRKDGSMVDVSLTISPVIDSSGKLIGASKVAKDITAQKRAAAVLAAQREWFRITLNSIADAVIACDAAQRVTFLNHEAEKLTGWSYKEADGQSLAAVFKLVHEEIDSPSEGPAELAIRLGRLAELEQGSVLVTRDGRRLPIAASAAPITDDNQRGLGVVTVFRDVSAAKRMEERNASMAAEKERLLSAERSARTEAERASKVKDEFVAMVSHELRTPLNAILGWTQLLLTQEGDREWVTQGLNVIARNTRLQAQLLSDLLDVSKILSGKLSLEYRRVDLLQVFADALQAVEAAAKAKGIMLRGQYTRSPLYVVGDPARVQQILLNLLSNAIKFTPAGGAVTLAARPTNGNLRISVTDTGVGISAEHLPRLFERFNQGSQATTRKFGGLGLGLSIAKHLAELHSGSIEASSPGEGQGATFIVTLPLMAIGVTARPIPGDVPATPAISLAGMKILVVEDDTDARDLLKLALEAHGAVVVEAEDVSKALIALDEERPTFLVSDIGLPDEDGYSLISKIRLRTDALSRIPAIAVTAFARPEDRRKALIAGFNAHVPKPVEPKELVLTVGSLKNVIGPQ